MFVSRYGMHILRASITGQRVDIFQDQVAVQVILDMISRSGLIYQVYVCIYIYDNIFLISVASFPSFSQQQQQTTTTDVIEKLYSAFIGLLCLERVSMRVVRALKKKTIVFQRNTSRCVTFEEPRPSSRGGLWPRSVKEPLRSSALRETLVEVCTAAAEHVSQV